MKSLLVLLLTLSFSVMAQEMTVLEDGLVLKLAKVEFKKLLDQDKDRELYKIFLQRMQQFKNNPPNYWDGNRAGIK